MAWRDAHGLQVLLSVSQSVYARRTDLWRCVRLSGIGASVGHTLAAARDHALDGGERVRRHAADQLLGEQWRHTVPLGADRPVVGALHGGRGYLVGARRASVQLRDPAQVVSPV